MAEVKTYYQADEPSDVAPGAMWLRSDGTKAQRGLSSEWIEKGSWTEVNDGMLPVVGGSMLGPVSGNHGHAPIDDPAFTGVMTLNGEEIPDKPWVTAAIEALQETLQNFITQSLTGGDNSISVGNNLAIGIGEVADQGAITLPKFADDTRAVLGEVWGVLVSPKEYHHGIGSEATIMAHECYHDPMTLIVTCRTRILSGGGGAVSAAAGTANYLIICKR